jgi:membrane protein DedA with SNARE-associated domain
VEHIDQFLAHYGYFALFGLLMLGIVGPLIPDETILVLAGIAAHQGRLDLTLTIAVAFAGSLCGITLSYLLGKTGAIYALERFGPVRRYVTPHLPKAREWFTRYGKWTLPVGYFVAGIRHFTALVAGMTGLSFRVFALYAWPGGLVWVTVFVLLGYFLGSQWETVVRQLDHIALGAAIAAAVGGLVWWLRSRRVQ